MKKKYFAPEIEEIEFDQPVVLQGVAEGSTGTGKSHDEEGGEAL